MYSAARRKAPRRARPRRCRPVSAPFLLAQLSDPHIGADWAGGDPSARLAAAVRSVLEMEPQPDALLVSGDLADHAADAEYEEVRALLAPIQAPLHVLPGNHDDRAALRRHFGVPGTGPEPVQYAVDLGPLRLVVLDTTRPGEDPGELDSERLAWLDATLAAEPDALTLVAMHHPPIGTGIPVWDELGLPVAHRQALAEVIARHRQVRRLVAGHAHRAITGEVAGRGAMILPSTYVQARLNFITDEIETVAEPAGFAVHAVVDGELISHVQSVG